MDIYQEYLNNFLKEQGKVYHFIAYIEDNNGYYLNLFTDESVTINSYYSEIRSNGKSLCSFDKITIQQNEDITKTKYLLFIYCTLFKNLYYLKDNERKQVLSKRNDDLTAYVVELDFNDKTNALVATINDDLTDELLIPIEYIEADKEVYYAKLEQQRINQLIAKASISYSCTSHRNDLVNIYFQPCSSDYYRTEIYLYHEDKFIAKYNVDIERYFISITELAYGKYQFKVLQFNSKGEVLLQSDKISFELSYQSMGNTIILNTRGK